MTRHTDSDRFIRTPDGVDVHPSWRRWRSSTTWWLRFALVAAFLSFLGQTAGVIDRWIHPPPTLHTRRITVGGQTVSLEIPDGQCATALGVTICVPDPSSRKVSP